MDEKASIVRMAEKTRRAVAGGRDGGRVARVSFDPTLPSHAVKAWPSQELGMELVPGLEATEMGRGECRDRGTRQIRGLYRGLHRAWILELALDAETEFGAIAVTGQCYFLAEGELRLFGGFYVEGLMVTSNSGKFCITGRAVTDWRASYDRLRITVPQVPVMSPPGRARVEWMDIGNSAGAIYVCAYQSDDLPSPGGGRRADDPKRGVNPAEPGSGDPAFPTSDVSGAKEAEAFEGRPWNVDCLPFPGSQSLRLMAGKSCLAFGERTGMSNHAA